MYNVQYFDYEVNRSFSVVCNTLEDAQRFLIARELENCEGFIEAFDDSNISMEISNG